MKLPGISLFLAGAACAQHAWVGLEAANDLRNLGAVAWNGATYVAVGSPGLIEASTDGMTWEDVEVGGATGSYGDVVWDGRRFVAVGAEGAIPISSDGRKWEDRPSPTRQDLWKVVHRGNRYVISGDTGTLCHSTDLDRWTCLPIATGLPFTSLAISDSVIAAFLRDSQVFISRNGVDWTGRPSGLKSATGSPVGIYESIWALDAFHALTSSGGLVRSRDGIVWEELGTISGWASAGLCWTGTRFIALSSLYGDIWSSADGMTWRKEQSPNQAGWQDIHCAEDRILAVGNSDRKYFSLDGEVWQSRYSRENPFLQSAAADDSLLVAVGESGNVFRTRDGKAWLASGSRRMRGIHGVAAFGGGFVAVGDSGKIMASGDGLTWLAVESPTRRNLRCVLAAGGRLFTGGDSSTLLASSDGRSWEKVFEEKAPQAIRGLAERDGMVVAVGDYGKAFYSADSTFWRPANRVTPADLFSVAWQAGAFHATGADGVHLTSANGWEWVAEPGLESPTFTKLLPVGPDWVGLNHTRIFSRKPGGNSIREHEHNTSDYHDALSFQGEIFAVGELHIARRVSAPIAVRRGKSAVVVGRIPRREPVRTFRRGSRPKAVDAGGRLRP